MRSTAALRVPQSPVHRRLRRFVAYLQGHLRRQRVRQVPHGNRGNRIEWGRFFAVFRESFLSEPDEGHGEIIKDVVVRADADELVFDGYAESVRAERVYASRDEADDDDDAGESDDRGLF